MIPALFLGSCSRMLKRTCNYYVNSIGHNRAVTEQLVTDMDTDIIYIYRDITEWFKHFDICCAANKWNDETKALKLPTLLEGEALATWLTLDEGDQKTYEEAKAKMTKILSPTEFLTLD